jgi:hypothetical protein
MGSDMMGVVVQATLLDPPQFAVADAVRRTAGYPRLRYMGSKFV